MKIKWFPSLTKLVEKQVARQMVNLKSPEGWLNLGNTATSGEVVTPDTAMKLSAVYACIRTNAENIASLPKQIIREDERGNISRVTDHPVFSLIQHQPNPTMTAFDFWETVMVNLQLRGNCFVHIIRNAIGIPVRLNILDFLKVQIYKLDGGDIIYQYEGNTIQPFDMLHYKLMSKNGLYGMSPIEMAMDNIGLALSAQKFGSKFYANNAQTAGVLEMEGAMSDPQYQKFQERHTNLHSGLDNAFLGIPIYEYGMKYKAVGMPLEQAQFIATREFQIEEICRIFNVPPHLVADLRRATFSNIEHQDIQYAKYTVRNYCRRIEKENDIKLFSTIERKDMSTKFNLDGLLRGDTAARTTYYKEGILNGFLTRNEVRALENMSPIDGLDEILVPLNMVEKSKIKTNE